MKIDSTWKFCVWGHRFQHTNTWVQMAMLRAASQHFGMQTFWLDDNSAMNFDPHHTLFFSIEGNDHAYRMPVREDCFYVLHNVCWEPLRRLWDMNRRLNLQTYTDDCLMEPCKILGPLVHFNEGGRCLYQPWATNLLPHEIDQYKSRPGTNSSVVNWVGTIGGGVHGNIEQIEPYKKACERSAVIFQHRNANDDEHIRLIRESCQAPTIAGAWQKQVGYIPCRIFKNISYGHMGVTNSERVNALFENRLIFNSDSHQLFFDAQHFDEGTRLWLMDRVKEKHTYINWLQYVFDCSNKVLGN